MTCDIHDVCLGDCESRVTFDTNGRPVPLPVAVSATAASPDPRDAEIARLCALRDRYFAAAVATADAIDGGNLGPVHSGGESDAEFESACVRYAEELPLRAVVVRAELAQAHALDSALRDCYALARAKLARESRPGGWADIVRFCESAGIKASPLRSAEARAVARVDPRGRDPIAAPECHDNSPPGYAGHWRDWHRGHGCNKDPEREVPRG